MFSPGSLTNATAEYALHLADQRNADANAVEDARKALAICPSCGADTYVERAAAYPSVSSQDGRRSTEH